MSKRYARAITAIFCFFIGGLMVWQLLLPDRERSGPPSKEGKVIFLSSNSPPAVPRIVSRETPAERPQLASRGTFIDTINMR